MVDLNRLLNLNRPSPTAKQVRIFLTNQLPHPRSISAEAQLVFMDVDEFAAKQKVESMVMEDILSRLLADVHTFGTAPMDPGSRGDLARLALLPDVLLCLFLSIGGMLDMSIPLVVGDTLRPMLSEDGTVRLEVIPPWTNDAPRSILLPHASQAALRWLLLRAPHTRSLSVFAGLRWPKGLMRG